MIQFSQYPLNLCGLVRIGLGQGMQQFSCFLRLTAAPETRPGAEPASKRQVRVAGSFKIVCKHQFHMSSRKKMQRSSGSVASHLRLKRPLNLARLRSRQQVVHRQGFVSHSRLR